MMGAQEGQGFNGRKARKGIKVQKRRKRTEGARGKQTLDERRKEWIAICWRILTISYPVYTFLRNIAFSINLHTISELC